jgi:hypothetical protein
MAEKYTNMAHFSANNTCASGAARRSGGNPEHNNKYLGGEHGENDKSVNGGTDEGTVSI